MATQVKKSQGNLPAGPGPGRPKGIPNKATGQLKDMILKALDGAGGAKYLEARANDPRTASAFLGLVGKVLPMTVVGDADNPLRAIVKIERVIVDPCKV